MVKLKLSSLESELYGKFLSEGQAVSPSVAAHILIVLCERGLPIAHWTDGYTELTEGAPQSRGVPWPNP